MNLKLRLRTYTELFDQRSVSEKALVALLLVLLVLWLFWEVAYAPARAENARLNRQIATTETRVSAMQAREQQAATSSVEDPNRAVRERIERAIADQQQLQGDIQQLAGNLVTPQSMTRLLTSILSSQSGLQLVRVENRAPQVMRSPGAGDAESALEGQQVFKHSLLLELQGDYLSLIAYLIRIESFPERFFWDQITFTQGVWPSGRITLELHTLSTERGFVGV